MTPARGRRACRLRRDPQPGRGTRSGERGSALVIAVLITVILALLGISFLLLGETENRIADNEKLSAQAFYVAESGARLVKRWFDDPGAGRAIHFPNSGVVVRTLRRIVDESDPYGGAAAPADGVIGSRPYYKQGATLFERPYRGSLVHALMGTEDGPDARIDDGLPAAAIFLDGLSRTLLADFPAEASGIVARISRIDVFAPPYIEVSGNWSRYGLGTVKVVARIYRREGANLRVLAEREVRAVLSETPYRGAYGPLHSCADLTTNGRINVRWGAVSAERTASLSADLPSCVAAACTELPQSLPRSLPPTPRIDLLWNGGDFAAFKATIDGQTIPDPWFRSISGAELVGAPVGSPQPYLEDPPPDCCDRSNLAHELPLGTCPQYDYDVWKSIASSAGSDVHYFRPSGAATFRENGVGPSRSFQEITHGAEGVYFFDTTDSLAPYDEDGDGTFDNLTPEIVLNSGNWAFRGFLFLNSRRFKVDGVSTGGVPFNPTALAAPAEPYLDSNVNGRRDAGEPWINLRYPTVLSDRFAPIEADADHPPGAAAWDARGPAMAGASPCFRGILVTSGRFEATGTAQFYGSVVAKDGVVQEIDDGSEPTPEIFWDQAIVEEWPPVGWQLPRVVITSWITER